MLQVATDLQLKIFQPFSGINTVTKSRLFALKWLAGESVIPVHAEKWNYSEISSQAVQMSKSETLKEDELKNETL